MLMIFFYSSLSDLRISLFVAIHYVAYSELLRHEHQISWLTSTSWLDSVVSYRCMPLAERDSDQSRPSNTSQLRWWGLVSNKFEPKDEVKVKKKKKNVGHTIVNRSLGPELHVTRQFCVNSVTGPRRAGHSQGGHKGWGRSGSDRVRVQQGKRIHDKTNVKVATCDSVRSRLGLITRTLANLFSPNESWDPNPDCCYFHAHRDDPALYVCFIYRYASNFGVIPKRSFLTITLRVFYKRRMRVLVEYYLKIANVVFTQVRELIAIQITVILITTFLPSGHSKNKVHTWPTKPYIRSPALAHVEHNKPWIGEDCVQYVRSPSFTYLLLKKNGKKRGALLDMILTLNLYVLWKKKALWYQGTIKIEVIEHHPYKH